MQFFNLLLLQIKAIFPKEILCYVLKSYPSGPKMQNQLKELPTFLLLTKYL
jgi:hypothetical protein